MPTIMPGNSPPMSTVTESIDVDIPVSTAYNQWTQFETFPQFMEGVESVSQLDDTHLRWKASIAGVEREWDAEITEQRPDERIAWASTSGTRNAGVVTFHRLDDARSRVMLQLDVEPWHWAGLLGLILALLAIDLYLHRGNHEPRRLLAGIGRQRRCSALV